MMEITLGISPCPNDTFIFYHLLNHQRFPFRIRPVIKDVEALNKAVLANELDISKVSFALAGRVLDQYIILDSGAALGRGCGPLILARSHLSYDLLSKIPLGIPGQNTTAALLLRLFLPDAKNLVEMPFHKIPEAIIEGQVEAGCVIHETRFTYKDFGLKMIQDLGKWWENTTGLPIPLGGIIAKRSLPIEVSLQLQEAIRQSIAFARENFDEVSAFVGKYAQEMAKDVQRKHIALYVNQYSVGLGKEGRAAVARLFELGMENGLVPGTSLRDDRIFLSP